jgi:hypothetical protein
VAAREPSRSAVRAAAPQTGEAAAPKAEGGGFFRRHRRAAIAVLGAVATIGFVYYVVPQIAGLGPTLRRLRVPCSSWAITLGRSRTRCCSRAELAAWREG